MCLVERGEVCVTLAAADVGAASGEMDYTHWCQVGTTTTKSALCSYNLLQLVLGLKLQMWL